MTTNKFPKTIARVIDQYLSRLKMDAVSNKTVKAFLFVLLAPYVCFHNFS